MTLRTVLAHVNVVVSSDSDEFAIARVRGMLLRAVEPEEIALIEVVEVNEA